jgi:hypothetical protein
MRQQVPASEWASALAPVIPLADEPDVALRVPKRVALQLSGHTHGDHVRLPFRRRVQRKIVLVTLGTAPALSWHAGMEIRIK